MKFKVLLWMFLFFIPPAVHAQCLVDDLSAEGQFHYRKAMEYAAMLRNNQNYRKEIINEFEAILRTDREWCIDVYKNLGMLCKSIAEESKNIEYAEKSISYYTHYLKNHSGDDKSENELNKIIEELELWRKTLGSESMEKGVRNEMILVEGKLYSDNSDCIHSFYIGKYEVTQAQWELIMHDNPSHFKGPNLPVENMSYQDVLAFINEVNRQTGSHYRLPTMAEWLYAAYGGNKELVYPYAGGYAKDRFGWFGKERTFEVGKKDPNILGIYDLSGNVAELCTHRGALVVLGGSYSSDDMVNEHRPFIQSSSCGFRLVLPATEYVVKEQQWDAKVYEYRRIQQRITDSINAVNRRISDSIAAVEIRIADSIERARIKRIKRQSYLPIFQLRKGFEGKIMAGYSIKDKTPYAGLSIYPGPVNAKVLLSQDSSMYLTAGLSLTVINRFDLNIGAAYHIKSNTFGADLGLNYGGFSGGVMLFEEEMIPHIGIRGVIDKEISSDYLFGYDIQSKALCSGFSVNYSNMYTSLMYQQDTSLNVMAGVNFFPVDGFSIHSGLAYNNLHGLGFDMGLRYRGLGVGIIKYKNHYVPELIIKQGLERAWDYHITSIGGIDFNNGGVAFGLSGSMDYVYATAMYQTDNNYYLALGGIGSMFDSRNWSFRSGLAYSRNDKIGIDFGVIWGTYDEEEINLSAGVLVFKDNYVPTVGLGGSIGFLIIGITGLVAGLIAGAAYLANG